MKYGDFRNLVKDFLNRKNLTNAQINNFINLAKASLQRKADYNSTVKRTTLAPYPTELKVGIALPSDFKSFFHEGAVTLVSPLTGGFSVPLEGTTFSAEQRRHPALIDTFVGSVTTLLPTSSVFSRRNRFYILTLGGINTIFLQPELAGALLNITYYSWLDPYTDTDEAFTDFFLDRGHDCLLYESLRQANMFEFEENRVPIDNELSTQAWMELVNYDARLIQSGAWVDVD